MISELWFGEDSWRLDDFTHLEVQSGVTVCDGQSRTWFVSNSKYPKKHDFKLTSSWVLSKSSHKAETVCRDFLQIFHRRQLRFQSNFLPGGVSGASWVCLENSSCWCIQGHPDIWNLPVSCGKAPDWWNRLHISVHILHIVIIIDFVTARLYYMLIIKNKSYSQTHLCLTDVINSWNT